MHNSRSVQKHIQEKISGIEKIGGKNIGQNIVLKEGEGTLRGLQIWRGKLKRGEISAEQLRAGISWMQGTGFLGEGVIAGLLSEG